MSLSRLINYASTDRQRAVLTALIQFDGSPTKAAKSLGVARTTVSNTLNSITTRAASLGYAPEIGMTRPTVDPFVVKGVSTLYNVRGDITAQWVKTREDDDKLKEFRDGILKAAADDLPRLSQIPKPSDKTLDSKLANLYTLTDCHVGALAWARESGEDWDLDIAEETLLKSFGDLVSRSPNAELGIVAQLGDFLHQDGLAPVTPTSGNILDSDGRFQKVIEIAVKVLRRAVDLALTKHKRVVVLIAEGNHDIASSVWLRVVFQALYENEPRVEIINSVLPYYVLQHGKVFLGWHHGHLTKNENLPMIFAAQFAKLWGDTEKRYIHVGHRHHVEEKGHRGVTVFQHSTLAARDAYAARHGWHAERQATAVTYHKDYGEVSRTTVTPEMVLSAASK